MPNKVENRPIDEKIPLTTNEQNLKQKKQKPPTWARRFVGTENGTITTFT